VFNIKKLFLPFLVIIIVLLQGCSNVEALPSGKETSAANKEASTPASPQKLQPENALLYGKYPDSILKAVAISFTNPLDFKKLTESDLKLIRKFEVIDDDGNYYGFKTDQSYDLSILTKMPSLERMLFHFKMSDYKVLRDLKNLSTLGISFVDDSELENVRHLSGLKSLWIRDSTITNLDFLSSLPLLEDLNFTNVTGIRDLSGLKYCTNLQQLNFLGSGDLDDKAISTLPSIPSLKWLRIINNKITKIFDFPKMDNLLEIELDKNPITSVDIPITAAPKLEQLSLANTQISSIDNIKGLENTLRISLFEALQLNYISSLTKFKKLESVALSDTDKKRIKDIDSLKNSRIHIVGPYIM